MPMAIDSCAEEKLARFGLTEGDVTRLVEALGNENDQARHVVRGALRELGEAAVPALHLGLTSENPTIRQEVAGLLKALERSF
jgi:hypothetical protein